MSGLDVLLGLGVGALLAHAVWRYRAVARARHDERTLHDMADREPVRDAILRAVDHIAAWLNAVRNKRR